MNYNIISIHKPSEEPISNIGILKPNRVKKYSGCHELKFSLCEYIKDNETDLQILNPDIQYIQYHYLCRFDGDWYIIEKIDKRVENQVKYIDVSCYGRAFQLNQYKCKVQTGIVQGSNVINALNLSDTARLVLQNTNYSVGEISVSLNTKFRAVDINSKCLSALDSLCEYWDCIWQESPDKKINFLDYKQGVFKGGYLTTENYIKSLSLDMKESSIITRLHIYGKDGISVHSVNFGKDYVDDFSFFKNLTYMSQEMINNLNTYETAIANNQAQYTIFLNELNSLQITLITKQNELDQLKTDETKKLIEIDATNADSQDDTYLKQQLYSIQSNISTKNSEISSIQSQITAKNNQITSLSNSLAITNFLTTDQIKLLNEYIIEDDFTDDVITSKGTDNTTLKELLEAGKEHLRMNNCPRVDVQVDLLGITYLNDPDSKVTVESLTLGSLAKIYVKKLDMNLDVRIISIEQDFEDCKVTVSLSNQKDIQDPSFRTKDLLSSAAESRDLIAFNIDNWMLGKEANTTINQYINSNINTISQAITNSTNSYELNERGLVFKDVTNPQYMSVYSSNGLLLSSDGGNNWNVAIGKGKVMAEEVGGSLIVGNNGKFNSIKIYNPSTNVLDCEIGNYTSGITGTSKRGIKIQGGSLEILGNAPTLNFGNNVVIDSTSGITVTRSDNKVRTTINATDGFKIASGSGGVFNNTVFKVDTNGQGYFGGIVNASDFQINNQSILNNGLIDGDYIESLSANKITAGTITASISIISPTITGGTIRTNSSGTRLEMTSSGLTCYSSGVTKNGISLTKSGINGGLDLGDLQYYHNNILQGGLLCNYGDTMVLYSENGNSISILSTGSVSIGGSYILFDAGQIYGLNSDSYTQGAHNHGISTGVHLATVDPTTGEVNGMVTWSASGGFTHSHSII